MTKANRGGLLQLCARSLATLAALGGLLPAHALPRDQLRRIVQQLCVPDWLNAHSPAPCMSVTLLGRPAGTDGYVVLADIKGGAHFLLIPIRSIEGIESPALRAPGAFNYLDAAWTERGVLATFLGRPVPQQAIGLAVNSIQARSQDQLHIHISCVRPYVHDALVAAASHIGGSWSSLELHGWHYQSMRIMGPTLGANPFALLASGVPDAAHAMGQFTMLVAGMQFKEGPGFIVLAGSAVPGAELLLDSSCALASEPARIDPVR